jgi:hypothetical protein
MTRKFNQQDYLQHPKKYELFKTAVLHSTIINENGSVPFNTVVGLTFVSHVWSDFYKSTLPLYALSTGDYCFGCTLKDFVL